MKFLKSNIIEVLILVSFLIGVLILMFNRSQYGSELTDEIFYISETRLINSGNIPIVNIWSQSPTFVYILSPLLSILMFSNTTTGLFLNFRMVSLIFLISASSIIFYFFMKIYDRKLAIIMFLLLFTIPFPIMTLSYNSLALIFMVLHIYSMYFYFMLSFGKKMILAFFSGIFFAFSIIAYPPILLMLLVYLPLTFNKRVQSFLINFYFGLIFIALIILGSILLKGGSISDLINGIRIILMKNPYFKIATKSKIVILIDQISSLITYILSTIRIPMLLTIFTILILCISKLNKTKKFTILNIYLIFYLIYFYNLLFNGQLKFLYSEFLLINSIFVLFFLVLDKEKDNNKGIIKNSIVIPNVLFLMLVSISTRDGFISRGLFLYPILMITPILFFRSFSENIKKYLIMFFLLSIISMNCYVIYNNVYRDSPINEMNCTIKEGLFKNIKTTNERCVFLTKVEKVIRQHTNSDEKVLFLDNVPFAYLMTDAQPFTPSTWDISLYTYGFNDPSLYYEYFFIKGELPDKIIYIHTDRDKFLSIEKTDYKFNSLIKEKYTLEYSQIIENHPILFYRLIEKQ